MGGGGENHHFSPSIYKGQGLEDIICQGRGSCFGVTLMGCRETIIEIRDKVNLRMGDRRE